ncbi:hypothetical protein GQ53DRAFT_775226 [Thozetella sp. PMI_491]|nr:hypothetical protein GQ53DRAFT_775226 [Thozetella sp. PMI_491]
MASVGTLSLLYPVFYPAGAAAITYLGYKAAYVDWRVAIRKFVTGPGRTKRILALLFLLLNLKSMPFGWTFRVFHTFLYHRILNQPIAPRSLFHYGITRNRNNMLDSDYNFHKSNSTYFADLDVSRSHLVAHLLGRGMHTVGDNERNKLVRDKNGTVMKGGFGIGLGAVFCSFKREIGMFEGFELWTRILSWDRKWLYMVTYYVDKGKVRPVAWDGKKQGRTRPKVVRNVDGTVVPDLRKHIIATAVSKYVFKLGRFTVHPAILLEANGLLPARPGGWQGGETGTGTPEDLGEIDESSEWDWKRVEYERRKGMEMADHFATLDQTSELFDGGEDGAIGVFPLA